MQKIGSEIPEKVCGTNVSEEGKQEGQALSGTPACSQGGGSVEPKKGGRRQEGSPCHTSPRAWAEIFGVSGRLAGLPPLLRGR